MVNIHGVIASEALICIHQVRHLPGSLPFSVRQTIANDSPVPSLNRMASKARLSKYEITFTKN